MRDDTTAGRQAIVKGEGMTMTGTARGALVEVITAVLEAGFGTLCRFNDLGGLKLRLVRTSRDTSATTISVCRLAFRTYTNESDYCIAWRPQASQLLYTGK